MEDNPTGVARTLSLEVTGVCFNRCTNTELHIYLITQLLDMYIDREFLQKFATTIILTSKITLKDAFIQKKVA